MANARLGVREALTGSTNVKEKGPPVADGVLSVTPDTPEVAEWRSRQSLDCVATTSSYLEDDDADGKKPHELFGKFTWKIENFSEISKRELRSNQFECGEYKWYILVYPQGCDVCNHLSLFLCVADYDKLLPGWSHFAQFTIAVVNKDPKKSKYSDTLHRFCKKEHDWGWKKFMELSKVLDGFTVADTLVIKAQVQVILDKPGRPFRCLDPQYRRELVRVYLTNVESICRRFCEEKRLRLAWVLEESAAFRGWWDKLPPERQRKLLTERGEHILKGVVKQFFNEKEVTSTLVMDALFSGCRQIEEHSRHYAQGTATEGPPLVIIRADRNNICLAHDVFEVVERASRDFIPPYSRDDKSLIQGADGLALRTGQEGDADFRRDSVERDERRLGELGKKTVEMFAIAHIVTEKLEVAFREAQALKRQELLIAEEEEAEREEEERLQAKARADKERRNKKKEKKKAKKEAERVKKEAEEEEKRRQEEERRVEQEKKAAEAAERKRQEDAAALQLQQQQQLLQKQRNAEKAASSRQQQEQAKQQQARATKAAAAPAASTAQPAASSAQGQAPSAAVLIGRLASPDAMQASTTGMRSGSSSPTTTSRANGTLTTGSDSDISSDSASTDSAQPQPSFPAAVGGYSADAGPQGWHHSRAETPGVAPRHEVPPAVATAMRRSPKDEEIITKLRARVRQLEAQLQEKDGELYAMREQLSAAQASMKEQQAQHEAQLRAEQQGQQELQARYEQQLREEQQARQELQARYEQQAAAAAAASAAAAAASAAAARQQQQQQQQAAAAANAGARDAAAAGRGSDSGLAGSRHPSVSGSLDSVAAADAGKGSSNAAANGTPASSHAASAWGAAAASAPARDAPQSPHSSPPGVVPPLVVVARENGKEVAVPQVSLPQVSMPQASLPQASVSQASTLHSSGSAGLGPRRAGQQAHQIPASAAPVASAAMPVQQQYAEAQQLAHHHQQHAQAGPAHMARPHSSGGGSGASSRNSSERPPARLSMDAPSPARPGAEHHGMAGQQPVAVSQQGATHQRSATHTGISGPGQQAAGSGTATPDVLTVSGAGGSMLRTNSAGLPSTGAMHGGEHGVQRSYAPQQQQQQQNVRREAHGMSGKGSPSPYMPPTSTGLSHMSQNGIAGVLHSSAPVQQAQQQQQQQQGGQQEGAGLPSYRNAAAGVMGAAGSASSTNTSTAGSIGLPPGIGPVTSAPPGVMALSSAGSGSDVGAAGNGTSSGSGGGHMGRGAGGHMQGKRQQGGESNNPFGGGLGMMQGPGVAQSRGLEFVQMQAKQRPANHSMGHMDNPGLDDFAHMNLIDDLLTE